MCPEISIVLPTYNGERFIQKSIESCLAQTFQNWELIVVNDCSTDATLDIVRRFRATDKRIKIISNKVNKKLPASLNVGFKAAKGDYLTWTSDDNYYAPDALEKMYNVFKTHKNIDFVYADMFAIDENDRILFQKRNNEVRKLYHGCCIGACFLYKRSMYEVWGPYNENMFCAEDYEYWMRLWAQKTRFYHLKESLYYYRRNPDSLSATKFHQIQEKTFQLKVMYWEKAPVGKFKKCLGLYKPYKKTQNPAMLAQIFKLHPIIGRVVHFIKLKGRL